MGEFCLHSNNFVPRETCCLGDLWPPSLNASFYGGAEVTSITFNGHN